MHMFGYTKGDVSILLLPEVSSAFKRQVLTVLDIGTYNSTTVRRQDRICFRHCQKHQDNPCFQDSVSVPMLGCSYGSEQHTGPTALRPAERQE